MGLSLEIPGEFHMNDPQKKTIFILLGATAVGKTDMSLKLAEEFHFQIVSADSMQVYRSMAVLSHPAGFLRTKGDPWSTNHWAKANLSVMYSSG